MLFYFFYIKRNKICYNEPTRGSVFQTYALFFPFLAMENKKLRFLGWLLLYACGGFGLRLPAALSTR